MPAVSSLAFEHGQLLQAGQLPEIRRQVDHAGQAQAGERWHTAQRGQGNITLPLIDIREVKIQLRTVAAGYAESKAAEVRQLLERIHSGLCIAAGAFIQVQPACGNKRRWRSIEGSS